MRRTFLLLSATLAGFTQAAPAIPPVCIVGAGPAGLTAASLLEGKGLKTIIFEKQARVGGKCQAVYDEGTYHPLGALLFSNATYTETLKVVNAAGVPAIPFSSTGGGSELKYNWTTGATEAPAPVTAAFDQLLITEILQYSALWETQFAPVSAVGYKNGVPQEYTVTTAEWLVQHSFQALPLLMIEAMVPYGYGDLRQVPILYMLQYFTPDIVLFFAQQHDGYLIDFHKVWTRFSKSSIKGPIHLDTHITRINRSGPGPYIQYRSFGPEVNTQKCSSIILAFPPTLANLKAANLDISPDEATVFTPVEVHNYYSGAVRLQTPFGIAYSVESSSPAVPPDADGEPVTFLKLFNGSNIATTWSWDADGAVQSHGQAEALLKSTLSKLNKKDPSNASEAPKRVTDGDVLGFRKWDYFPHFDSQHLAGGWYDKFNKLQGQKKTYYASGLNGFETVEFAIRAGQDVVKSYF